METVLRFETTIQNAVETGGVGLHSGVPVKIRVTPAPAATG
ncbi:MAG: UDP-3-O-acyl-N-acetylglucosamine deacetylase, partial [Acidobacteriota bacterium]|nr:UDP-3-O-acyl-N-acetylglucosamine deacetylase [Acidobacteriota bacterium]